MIFYIYWPTSCVETHFSISDLYAQNLQYKLYTGFTASYGRRYTKIWIKLHVSNIIWVPNAS